MNGTLGHYGEEDRCIAGFSTDTGRRKFRRSKHRRYNGNKVDLKEIGWEGMDWVHLACDKDKRQTALNTVMKSRIPQNAENFWKSQGIVTLLRTLLHEGR